MHGKGSGAVNRVELECQVLCAALRQSWVRQDKVGAFTSIRELSHLFPDLLPPPEEKNGSNKANYYETLTIRPQAGLNSIVIGYLKTVRKFLKEYNPKDYRQFYNTVLNAGFVLRKPRLRLSHDLVVARRWLYESQMEDDIETEGTREEEEPSSVKLSSPAPELAPTAEKDETKSEDAVPESFGAEPVSATQTIETGSGEEAVPQAPVTDEDEDDPLSQIEKSWDLARSGKGDEETGKPKQSAQKVESIHEETEPLETSKQEPVASEQAPLAPVPEAPQTVAKQDAPNLPQQAHEGHPQHQRRSEFVFDEDQLHMPDIAIELPSIVGLMEYAHLITKVEVQALKAQIQLAPNIPVEQLVLNAGYANRQEINSLRLAQDLLSSGKITMAQFQVAMYDERTSGLRMAESLQVRGWLQTEVKNIVEELKKPES